MRKKIFTFLLALAASVGMSWATVITWDQSKLSSMAMNIESGSGSKASDGIEVTAVSTGEFVRFCYGGAIEIGNGEGSGGGYLTFTSSVGNIAQIDIYHSGAGEWNNANGDWISPYYENFEGGIFTWSGTPAASITLTGDAPRHIENITSIEFTIENGGGSAQAGLQVTELQVSGSWEDNPTMLSTSDMPGFIAVSYAEAAAWDAAPAGNVVLIFAFEENAATSLYFKNGVCQPTQAYNITYEDLYAWYLNGDKIFYTGGGSTPAPTPAESVTVVFEANNNQKEVEVTLPHTFACDFQNGNGELDGIIQELYALQYGGYCQAFTVPTATGNAAVTASKDGNNHYIAISEAFEGTATVTGSYIKYLDTEQMGNTSVDYTLTISVQGSTLDPEPATGLQVVEVTSDIYDGWNSNSNTFTVDALPGFQAVTFDEAKEWTGVPTSGTAALVYRTNGDYARVIHFFDGDITGDYDLETSFNQMYENITIFGNRIFYTAGGGSTPTPTPDPTPTPSGDGDKLAGAFSVGGNKVVYFSKANLQATTADNGSTWTWGFAENQWDYVGNSAANNAINGGGTVSANGPVDLFAWSSTANNYFGINNSINEADYSGDFKDWGAKKGSDWRTLTINEWQYLLQERNPGSSSANHTNYPRYTNAQILTDGTAPQKDIKGIILFPDDFNDGGESIDGVTWGSINPSFYSSYPTYCTTAGWATLESMGCVFLPSAGSRQNFGDEFAILNVNQMGNYWSSTLYSGEPEDPQSIVVGNGTLGIGTNPRYFGMSVRLVSETAPSGGSTNPEIKLYADFGGDWADTEAFTDNGDGTATLTIPSLEAKHNAIFVKKDGVQMSSGHNFTRENPSADVSGNQLAMWFDTDEAGEYTFTFEYSTNILTITYPTPTPTPAPSDDANKLPGAFSVSGTKVVYFSKGNLQATTADNGSTWTWGFAENQYDFIGNNAANNAINGGGTVSTNGAVDLFGWSSTDNNYYGIDNSTDLTDYDGNFQDWSAKVGSDWRALNGAQWEYLLLTREPGSLAGGTSNPRFTRATILTDGTAPSQDIFGLILFPDNFNDGGEYIDGVTWNGINSHSSYVSPTYCTTAGWATLESMGCVFLPAPGWRSGNEVTNVGAFGIYWSSTKSSEENASCIYFSNSDVAAFQSYITTGASVRLVSETAPSPAPTSFTFPAGTTIYYDFTAYGNGINVYAPGAPTDWYSSSANIIPVTLSSDWEISESTNLFKSEASGWNFVTGTILPTDGQNMIVSTNGVDYAWGTHVPAYTVAGEPAVAFGTPTWTPTNTDNDMVKQSNGTYKWEKEDVELAKDAVVSFKVCQDHGWDVAYPNYNFNHTIPADGLYTLTITFDPNAEGDKVAIDATKTADVVVAQTAEMKGFGDWNTGIALENINEGAAARVTKNLAAGTHEFKMIINDGWRGKVGATITRANNTVAEIVDNPNESNITLTADIPGDYTFTWTYAENTLSVEFPSLVVYVQNLIDAIGEVNLESGDAINAARTAYDNLLDADQKQAVNNYSVLEAAEATYAALAQAAADQLAANNVKNLIDAIDNPVVYTNDCKAKIDAARAAYDALTEAQKTLVGDEYAQKLADAEAAYDAFIVYTVAGEPEALFGSFWNIGDTNNDMVKQSNGTYKWEKSEVALAAGTAKFKIIKDHVTYEYPTSNYELQIEEDGIYTVTIIYNPKAAEDRITTNALKTGEAVIVHTAEMKGSWNNWTDGLEFENINEGAAARAVKILTPGTYEFKMIIDGSWLGEASMTFTRNENAKAEIGGDEDNLNLTADIPGCYTFTWTYETNTLEIGYPSLTMDVAAIVNNQAGTLVEQAEQVEGTPLNFGVAADGSRVAADAPNAVMTVVGSFKNEHGLQSPTFTVMVPGSVDIYVGKCTYSTKTINVRNANNDIVASKTPTAACWKTDHANMTVLHYTGEATTLTISGMDFCPYIRVKNASVVDPLPAYINVQAQVNSQAGTLLTDEEKATQGNAVSLGVNAANERVAADAANAIMTVAGNYHSEHGLTNSVFTVRVPGNVDIYVGECDYSATDIIVKDEDNNIVTSLTPAATACWKNDHNNVVVLHYVGGANTLTISGMQYCPYVCVKSTPVEVPAEMDIQAIVNNQAGTLVAQAEQVQGTPLNFGVAADGSRVAVDNPNAILYVDGKYHNDHGMYNPTFTVRVPGEVEIYVGECTYSTATIEVRNAANELVDSKTPEAVCWKSNPDNVAVLHYTGEATTLTISGMTYCPFIRVKTPTAPVQITIGDPNNASEVETFLTTYDGQTVPDLTIDRPVLNNMYNTLCLPFHMDADQIANSSLNGVEIYEFIDADVTNDELYLYTSEEKHEIVAGRPYLVKFSAASQLDELNFIDVEINNADLDDQAVTIKGVTFKGTFQPIVLGAQEGLNFNGGHLFLAADNTLYWPNTNNPLKPFRAYFTVNVDAGQSAGMPVRRGMPAHIGGPAQIVTGVDQITNDQSPITNKVMINGALYIIRGDKMYDAQGQVIK